MAIEAKAKPAAAPAETPGFPGRIRAPGAGRNRQGDLADRAARPRSPPIMVLIMTAMLAVFFLGIDQMLGRIVKFLLSLAGLRTEPSMSRWYIIHAYSGFENKVRDAILAEATRMGLDASSRQSRCRPKRSPRCQRGKKVRRNASSSPAMCWPSWT